MTIYVHICVVDKRKARKHQLLMRAERALQASSLTNLSYKATSFSLEDSVEKANSTKSSDEKAKLKPHDDRTFYAEKTDEDAESEDDVDFEDLVRLYGNFFAVCSRFVFAF